MNLALVFEPQKNIKTSSASPSINMPQHHGGGGVFYHQEDRAISEEAKKRAPFPLMAQGPTFLTLLYPCASGETRDVKDGND